MVPALLILLATLAAAAVAFGTHPNWVAYAQHGVDMIMLGRRIEWPLTFLAIVLCVVLIGLVAAGRRRVFWLLGLAPVAAMLFHHFSRDPMNGFAIRENPPFADARAAATLVGDDDYVVGLRFGDNYYAYPYATLYTDPVIFQVDRGRRLLLVWNAFANRAVARVVDKDVRPRELDIVSMPANALLLYNGRLGQFINGLTSTTPAGKPVTGFVSPVATSKVPWKQWRSLHPETRVLALPPRYATGLPRRAVLPYFPVPGSHGTADARAGCRIVLVDDGQARLALAADRVTDKPLNLTVGGTPVLVFRDPQSGQLRAFDRRFDPDLTGEFRPNADPARPNVALVDAATGTGWNWSGVAVDGDARWRGRKLTLVSAEDDLYLDVMKFWYPDLTLHEVRPEDTPPAVQPPTPEPEKTPTPSRRRRR